ncbi:hypothetical protein SAICODRAFT_50921 [Saitoella complicata NRRL Y-17804]|uniref:uncharacterized protein n=1 Tax=Saitoella complicata (strain BCRC 22490 / CBS 7301 / JCM 7358 / NBRC 10748 / NRRL Y-17804) TaxID=698492 RepID=UPI0008679D78|nr:uncharacterized protein SAICODRAFT_50921 [Saitoella complicata NRRL Y-17804]ODQ56297.1 hypothetical protein SAICODRAFT_50921 [Saitoella complicata NRRL Y-17804]
MRRTLGTVALSAVLSVALVYCFWCGLELYAVFRGPIPPPHPHRNHDIDSRFPLIHAYLVHGTGDEGGRWYIPPSWIDAVNATETPLPEGVSLTPTTVLDAAYLVVWLCSTQGRMLRNTNIPRVVHQSWRDADVGGWPRGLLPFVEEWLEVATGTGHPHGPRYPPPPLPPLHPSPSTALLSHAYFLWTDTGMSSLLHAIATSTHTPHASIPGVGPTYRHLPRPVERADFWRVQVLRWIGGVYADTDARPLREPAGWVQGADLRAWRDAGGRVFDSPQIVGPVNIILGIEADDEESWRMGYHYPVQLTQWTLASAPHHPILEGYTERLCLAVHEALTNVSEGVDGRESVLSALDPVDLTGPVAVTAATRAYLDDALKAAGSTFDTAFTSRAVSKPLLDTLILPITAFSPGRSTYWHNMGSKPVTHPDARVQHMAQGTWRKGRVGWGHWGVEVGKACRTVLGMCRDWRKID